MRSVGPALVEWEKRETLPEIGDVVLRPIRPDDERLYANFLAHVTPEDLRLRFFGVPQALSHETLVHLTRVDCMREMAFVAVVADGKKSGVNANTPATGDLLGVSRFAADSDRMHAEYAVIVRSDLKAHGLGWLLMRQLIDYATAAGIVELYGFVLAENVTMMRMCRELGFTIAADPGDPAERHVSLWLNASPVAGTRTPSR